MLFKFSQVVRKVNPNTHNKCFYLLILTLWGVNGKNLNVTNESNTSMQSVSQSIRLRENQFLAI